MLTVCPRNNGCPAGENQAWLGLVEEGRVEAFRKITEENLFPAVMGRVCYHPCESACNRKDVDWVGILGRAFRRRRSHQVKFPFRHPDRQESHRRCGPAGLTAAYHLRKFGHDAVVVDAAPKAGSMLRYGIPKYRLPREKLNAEIHRWWIWVLSCASMSVLKI